MGSDAGSPPPQRRRLKLRIPQNITREHVIQAIEEIRKKPAPKWPPRNNSTTYDLFHEGERYPPKIVVMYANKYANGELFDVNNFSGGEATTNRFFGNLGFTIISKKEIDSTDGELQKDLYSASLYSNTVNNEIKSRLQIWQQLKAHENATNLSPDLLREELRIYRGAAGIWVEKGRTASLSGDEYGITISVLHTGKSYPDDVGENSIIYHYPQTDRSGTTDQNEIKATKNAKKFNVPIFIITHSKQNDKLRDVRLGYVIDWNDANKTFLIEFSHAGEMQAVLSPAIDDQPFDLFPDDTRVSRKSTSPKRDPNFRFNVLKRYGSKCAVCSMTIDNLLTAAHIVPKESRYSNDDVRNGIVLCHNHHDAFDNHLFGIHPETKKIITRPKGHSLSELKIESEILSLKQHFPHDKVLGWRYKKFEESLNEKR